MSYEICPRCHGAIPNNDRPGEYPGALSRVYDVEICSPCGSEEADEALYHCETPVAQWPVVTIPEPR